MPSGLWFHPGMRFPGASHLLSWEDAEHREVGNPGGTRRLRKTLLLKAASSLVVQFVHHFPGAPMAKILSGLPMQRARI